MVEGVYAHRCTRGGAPRPHLIVQCTGMSFSHRLNSLPAVDLLRVRNVKKDTDDGDHNPLFYVFFYDTLCLFAFWELPDSKHNVAENSHRGPRCVNNMSSYY
jgi:hypothetical protein